LNPSEDIAEETTSPGFQIPESSRLPAFRLLLKLPSDFRVIELPTRGRVVIGRSDNADVCVDDPMVSRQHARLAIRDGTFALEDLASVNGIFFRGNRVPAGVRVRIEPGEVFFSGSTLLVLDRATAPVTYNADSDSPIWLGMEDVEVLARRVASRDVSLMLDGETGVGKGVLADAIHRWSPRATRPLVSINCAAVSEEQFEYDFSRPDESVGGGAERISAAVLQRANGGTVFLDDICELSAANQVRLLRFIDSGAVSRTHRPSDRTSAVRLIAASNRKLEDAVSSGQFRADLMFRLAEVVLSVPPLRQRPLAILTLAERFLRESAQDSDRPPPPLSSSVLPLLLRHSWPGNIRELRNVIQRAALLSHGSEITKDHLPSFAPQLRQAGESVPEHVERHIPLRAALERDRILEALAVCGHNQSRAAALLGISRRSFVNKLDVYAIPRPRKAEAE
jgi:two-component system response regulator AtoC